MSFEPLYLLHTRPDPQQLAAWAARHRLLDSQGDLGYALHALLRAAFGDQAPQPFRYMNTEQGLLAFSRLSAPELARLAAMADVDVSAALGLGQAQDYAGLRSRAFPLQWTPGHLLGFEVRVRPIIREGKTGRERDAFLSAIDKTGDGQLLDRSEVYVQWLRELFKRQGGAELVSAKVTSYQQLGVTRKSHKGADDNARQGRLVRGPDAVLAGQLRVKDSSAFAKLLAGGIGRHKAFGFGLLLLRSANR
jgi:CRISPR system Cascade subunit CasE